MVLLSIWYQNKMYEKLTEVTESIFSYTVKTRRLFKIESARNREFTVKTE